MESVHTKSIFISISSIQYNFLIFVKLNIRVWTVIVVAPFLRLVVLCHEGGFWKFRISKLVSRIARISGDVLLMLLLMWGQWLRWWQRRGSGRELVGRTLRKS